MKNSTNRRIGMAILVSGLVPTISYALIDERSDTAPSILVAPAGGQVIQAPIKLTAAPPVTPPVTPSVTVPAEVVVPGTATSIQGNVVTPGAPAISTPELAIPVPTAPAPNKPVSEDIKIRETIRVTEKIEEVPLATQTPQSQTPVSVSGVVSNVSVDNGDKPIWKTMYPGPYGEMPLADALIAQIVPTVGAAIELNGPLALMTKKVVVPKGQDRISTLNALASKSGLNISLSGTTVTASGSGAQMPAQIVAQSTPIAPLAAESISTSTAASASDPVSTIRVTEVTVKGTESINGGAPQPIVPAVHHITKQWKIAQGEMLSVSIQKWAEQWNWKLIWKADVDFRMVAPLTLDTDFLDGVGQILDAYRFGDRPLWGDWNELQRILVVREPSIRARNR